MGERQPGDGEGRQRDEHRRHGRVEHVADVGEDVDANGRRGQHRGIGQQRELVTEVGARDDGAGHPPFGEPHGLPDAHQRHADRGDRRPRTAGHQRHDGADGARGNEEKRRMEDLQAIIDQRGDHPRDHPRAGDGADQQQDEDGRSRGADVFDDRLLEHRPAAAVQPDREHHADRRGREQRNLAAAVDGPAPEGADHHVEQQGQHHQRNGRHPRRREFGGIFLHGIRNFFAGKSTNFHRKIATSGLRGETRARFFDGEARRNSFFSLPLSYERRRRDRIRDTVRQHPICCETSFDSMWRDSGR